MTHKIMRRAAMYFALWFGAYILAVIVCVAVTLILTSFLEWAAHYFGG